MNCLNSREQDIIARRYLQDNSETLANIGKDLGVTKERIRQIESRAIRKMRHHLLKNSNEVRSLLESTE
jgi:RNA polymerase sigma-32 factor